MKLDQIRAFIAVVETGSFRSAADAIHKTQPGISAAVKALEEQYNIRLFDRDSYRPTLTTEGHAFYRQSQKLMNQVQQLEHLGHNLSKGSEVPLRISLSQMVLNDECMAVIKQFQLLYPEVSLDITTEHLYGVQESLLKDKAEIAIGPRYGLDDRHAFTELMSLKMMTVVAPELLGKLKVSGSKVKQPSLYSIPHILVTDSAENDAENGHTYVLPTGKRWYVNDFLAKKTLLVHGLGWARMPYHLIQNELKSGELVTIEVENFTSFSDLPVFMIRLNHQTLSYQANLFWETMKNCQLQKSPDPMLL